MAKYPIRTDEFRARAAAETQAGAASPLEQVRAKHERAAKVWADMAEAEEARGTERQARLASAAVLRA